MSIVADIADAVVTDLNLGAFSQALTAARAYRPAVELEQLKDLHVIVIPKATTREMVARNQAEHETQIDIGVQKRVDPSDNAACDALDSLCEEIASLFAGRVLGDNLAICTQVERKPLYDPEHLSQKRVFTGVITITVSHFS